MKNAGKIADILIVIAQREQRQIVADEVIEKRRNIGEKSDQNDQQNTGAVGHYFLG